MRNRFTELIQSGIASFSSTPVGSPLPNTDEICRVWNNIFSIPSLTHMHIVENVRVITGSMVGRTEQWEKFLASNFWGAVSYKSAGYWCPADFLYRHGLRGEYSLINGSTAYVIKPIEEETANFTGRYTSLGINGSSIPKSTAVLAGGDINKVKECFKPTLQETVNSLNESLYVAGNNWIVYNNNVIGLVGNEVIKLETI